MGRSNVGKSSLTNVLINRNSYAHTSSQPGKTQTLNFYHVESQLYFVDVPGYGYAKASRTDREKWGQMIETYLTQREQLRGVVSLVDGRHAPTKDDRSSTVMPKRTQSLLRMASDGTRFWFSNLLKVACVQIP